jgi:UDP-2,3-diacylglucosamine hydrolase
VKRFGLIAGNGRFPVLALEAARENGDQVIAIGIKEEAPPEIEQLAARTYWISLGDLSKLIDICHKEDLQQVIMAGQVKHVSIFSTIRPDWRLAKLLLSLTTKNTDSLIGGVAKILADEGVQLVPSTRLLTNLLADVGAMGKRKPDESERRDLEYGQQVANALSGFDIGQSVAIADGACVAVEAMEGTDVMLRRAASLANGKALRLIKASGRRKHMLWDVPVVGPQTIETMVETKTTALAIDAQRTLMLDKKRLLQLADQAKISVWGHLPQEEGR